MKLIRLLLLTVIFLVGNSFIGEPVKGATSDKVALVSMKALGQTYSSSHVNTDMTLVLQKPSSLRIQEVKVDLQSVQSPKNVETITTYVYTNEPEFTVNLESWNFQIEGEWVLSRLSVRDQTGVDHELELTHIPDKKVFTLAFPKPKLTKVDGISKTLDVTQLNRVKSFFMTIDLDGLKVPTDPMSLILENKQAKEEFYLTPVYHAEKKQFEVDLSDQDLNEWNAIGTWSLKRVSFYDDETNHRYEVQLPVNLKPVFQVTPDTTLPVFKSVKMVHSKTKDSQLVVQADDNSGFFKVKATFKHLPSGITKTLEPWEGRSKVAKVDLNRRDFGMAGKWELIGLDVIDMYDNVLTVKSIPKGLAMAFEEYDVDSRNWVVTSGTVNLTKLFEENRYIERIIVLEGATLIVNADVTLPIHAYGTVIVEKGKRVKETVYAKQFKSGTGKLAGTVYLKGNNTIKKRVVTKTPYNLGLVELSKGISLNEDKKTFNLKGLALPGTKAIKIDGKTVAVQKNGTFAMKGLIAKGRVVTIEVTDRYGKKHISKHKVYDYKQATAKFDLKPGIYKKGTVLKVTATKDAEIIYNGFKPGDMYAYVGGFYQGGIPLLTSLMYEIQLFDPVLGGVQGPKGEFAVLDVKPVSNLDRAITGVTKPKTVITVRVNGKTYTATADSKGKFAVNVSLKQAKTYTIQAVNGKLKSPLYTTAIVDKIAPAKATVNAVTAKSGVVQGKAEPKATVVVTYGKKTMQTKVTDKGTYKLIFKGLKKGTTLSVRVKDAAGNLSPSVKQLIK
ncbi:Ig-like domain-containing protein [Exiguobacterium aurantiacum]|uniref:Ig-like domain-containing protein n=3 Tax=Exiguobacterium TaxID=33986 RepID=A0ABY5FPY2_9BACL|nr:Ig-like domain-containing protein [Exiguobacterium aurantiacum]UTT43501.1 Ig-like domain-containing protein [Exiguobacterium aurantiacum]